MSHVPEKGWIRPVGPKDRPRIAIVGEAPGEEEERIGIPFVGKSGKLLDAMLRAAKIARGDCYLTNVFLERPLLNELEPWCVAKREADLQWAAAGNKGKYPHAPLIRGKYLQVERLGALTRLKMELEQVRPNMVLAFGNTACWALLGTSGITSLRGTVALSTLVPGLKVLPTFHPAAVLRQWDYYPITMADILKAARTCHTPELELTQRHIHIAETLEDLEWYYQNHLLPATSIAVDVETKSGQITCIGFATGKKNVLVVPFWDTWNKTTPHAWATPEQESAALRFIRKVLTDPSKKIIFQNGLYDIQYIWRTWGIPLHDNIQDTMLIHHALQPELPKGLGFLGSIYADEPAWKQMRKQKADTEKRDE